jgi:hypothetical protein
MNDDGSSSTPLFLAVSAILFAGQLSAITVVLEEEEYIANVQVAAKVIASSLVSFCHKQ